MFASLPAKSRQPRVVNDCKICGLTFKKPTEYQRHMEGKRHAENVRISASPEALWNEFQTGASHWADGCVPGDVEEPWSMTELSTLNFKFRKSCLHPSAVVGKLNPYQRARVWRYLRDVMGMSHYSEMATIMAAVECDVDGHLRLKEIFESFETYKILSAFVVATTRTLASQSNPVKIKNIVELASGHGLVGLLLAYRFPDIYIHSYDLHKRKTFDAFVRAFEKCGHRRPGADRVLPNVHFHEADLMTCTEHVHESIVVCIHGCGDANTRAVELAQAHGAVGFAVMPCCILKDNEDPLRVHVADDTMRYHIMCGALANQVNAQLIMSIDERITNRPVVIAGGVGAEAGATENGARVVRGAATRPSSDPGSPSTDPEDLAMAVRRGRMPRLLLS